jgi:hypothetical protein
MSFYAFPLVASDFQRLLVVRRMAEQWAEVLIHIHPFTLPQLFMHRPQRSTSHQTMKPGRLRSDIDLNMTLELQTVSVSRMYSTGRSGDKDGPVLGVEMGCLDPLSFSTA